MTNRDGGAKVRRRRDSGWLEDSQGLGQHASDVGLVQRSGVPLDVGGLDEPPDVLAEADDPVAAVGTERGVRARRQVSGGGGDARCVASEPDPTLPKLPGPGQITLEARCPSAA